MKSIRKELGLPQAPRDRLIFALDVDHLDEAERLVKELSPHVGMFKVGSRLFTSAGSLVVDLVHGMGSSVFLDFKFHDIPEQIAGAAREIARQRARLFTVHALGGPKMIEAVTRSLRSMTLIPGVSPPVCCAVTILTSHSQEELKLLGFNDSILSYAQRLAKMAVTAGAGGVVCSGHELSSLRSILPTSTLYVVPGIRGPSDEHADQVRVMTAGKAVQAGATWVVVGRPIRDAREPASIAQQIVEEIAEAEANEQT
ncbi:MAG: orotidine-5'-phosphate decarboxylase [Myxococcales bacterium]|nr:orotidine-5'-phosphate decarboxylase [Myxococcales bacterium]